LDKVLNLLGLAKRAKRLVLGSEAVLKTFPSKKIAILFIANDASDATKDKFEKKAFFYQTKVVMKYTTFELSKALGVTQIKLVGVIDQGFAEALIKEIERG